MRHFLAALLVLSLPGVALSAPAQQSTTLTSKAKAAFANITKAKSALNDGNSKQSDSYLGKAETLLKSVMGKVPGGSALAKTNSAAKASDSGEAPQAKNTLSQAEGEAAKLDPSLANKLGVAKEQSAQGDTNGASSTLSEAKGALAEKTGLSGIQDTYEKVTAARSLLKIGDSSKAKGILDQIPGSPAGLLKGL